MRRRSARWQFTIVTDTSVVSRECEFYIAQCVLSYKEIRIEVKILETRCVDIVCWFETGQSADRDDYGDTFRPGTLEREGGISSSLEATTRRCRRPVENRSSSSNPIVWNLE
ncbi:hypothetical protein J6590_063100 [Homalodisca vitripennis]|nr:hypothetical protein J6590_063100 [Homalodisca vitripennis]